jgi:hypothetical protein
MKTWTKTWMAAAMLALAAAQAGGQTPRTGKLMREKLVHAQRILEALTTSNHALLEREATALARVTESPDWWVLRSPEFRGHSDRFLKVANELAQSARDRDLDAASAQYASLTTTCYQCHKYVKDSRIAIRRIP